MNITEESEDLKKYYNGPHPASTGGYEIKKGVVNLSTKDWNENVLQDKFKTTPDVGLTKLPTLKINLNKLWKKIRK